MISTPNKGEAVDRSHVWLAAWVAVATANDCKAPRVATDWADACLAAFDERFAAQRAAPGRTTGAILKANQEA